MAKKSVKISLATKLRMLFGASVLGIIAAALVVPWYFMEQLSAQGVEREARAMTKTCLNEWLQEARRGNGHPTSQESVAALDRTSGEFEGRKGPTLIKIKEQMRSWRATAREHFQKHRDQNFAIYNDGDEFRCFRAVRTDQSCLQCHGPTQPKAEYSFQTGQLVGIIDMTIPRSGALVLGTRLSLVVGGALAALLAFVLFAIITQRLILRPVRHLRAVADKVIEGNLSVHSAIQTGDELQRLGESFNEMLGAINDQHEKLRSANRALDLKLRELEEANVTLFQANQVKNEFLANVSHELRTPLNSIIGFADLLADNGDDKFQRYGQNISSSAKNLLNMINDLLDIAKIEAGKAVVRLDKVSVLDTCQTLLALMGPLADKKQLSLQSQMNGQLPLVTTDGAKLQQILYNLLSNAIKFTPAGGQVTLCAANDTLGRDGATVPAVSVSVADTGPGISEADQQHIFEKFYQLDRTLTKEASGTGLGLAITRELTALLGGRLSLKSSPGSGAVFTVTVGIDPPAAQQSQTRPDADNR